MIVFKQKTLILNMILSSSCASTIKMTWWFAHLLLNLSAELLVTNKMLPKLMMIVLCYELLTSGSFLHTSSSIWVHVFLGVGVHVVLDTGTQTDASRVWHVDTGSGRQTSMLTLWQEILDTSFSTWAQTLLGTEIHWDKDLGTHSTFCCSWHSSTSLLEHSIDGSVVTSLDTFVTGTSRQTSLVSSSHFNVGLISQFL